MIQSIGVSSFGNSLILFSEMNFGNSEISVKWDGNLTSAFIVLECATIDAEEIEVEVVEFIPSILD